MKNKNGITLIALIITIIVMLILVGVTINLSANAGLFQKTREAAYGYDIAQIKENLADYQLDYYQNTGYILSDNTMTKLAEISKKTGVDAHKFTVYYDQGNDDSILIFYNWKKATLEEIKKLEEMTISEEDIEEGLIYNRAFIADVDGDGYLTEDDFKKILKVAGTLAVSDFGMEEDKKNYYKQKVMLGDLSKNSMIDTFDSEVCRSLISEGFSYKENVINREQKEYYLN